MRDEGSGCKGHTGTASFLMQILLSIASEEVAFDQPVG